MKKKLYFILVLLIILIACEKTVYIDIPDKGRMITVNSLFNPDSLLKVSVSKSCYIMNNDIQAIENATVEVYENGNLIETLAYLNNGLYKSTTQKPSSGNTYKIKVTVPDMGTVETKSYIPLETNIISIDTASVMRTDIDGYRYEQLEFRVKFKDDANTNNYYLLEPTQIGIYTYDDDYNDTIITDTTQYFMYVESNDPSIVEYLWGKGLLFNDNLFNGNTYEFVFSSEKYFYDTTSIVINLKSISEDYFKYLATYYKHMDANWDPFMEKISVYSNVEGGVGVFGGYSTATDTIVVYGGDDYIK
ncbi:MAG: DUF4249 domain-containing protein [Bacteroidales bacterium]|nr:DUF4249 domain-containing protein [Bacteroidales bacterium]